MNNADNTTPGIEVHEKELNEREQGFLSGVFEAMSNRTMTEAEFREAMELLIAQENEQDR